MDQVPTNILIKIFEHLNNQDLIAISCTCKKFLETTSNFMAIKFPPVRIDFSHLQYNKLKKFIYKEASKDFNVLIETTRQFQNYVLINFNKEHTDRVGKKWLQLFKNQINARTIRIKSDCMDINQLYNMLKICHRLVYLEIDGYRLAKPTSEEMVASTENTYDNVNLPSLRHLKINSFLDATPQLFDIFQHCHTLKTISFSALFMVTNKLDSINNLICNQKELEHLDLIGLDTHNALFQCEHEISYKLKNLNVEYNGYSMNLEKFVEFFIRQKSLKEVKLTLDLKNSMHVVQDRKLCDEIIRHCMSLQHLKSFNLHVNKYPIKDMDMPNMTALPLNKCIKKFSFENESRENNNLLILLLRSLPNLKSLELMVDYDDILLNHLPSISKLKHLKLIDYHQGLLKSIKCSETLESISLKYCYSRNCGQDWIEFLQHHPRIKKIQIDHSIDFIDDVVCEVIAGAAKENLEHFEMRDSVAKNISTEAYKSFQRHCCNLRYLRLTDRPSKRKQNKNQSFHDLLSNIKCVISFYVICIIFFVVLILLMVFEKI